MEINLVVEGSKFMVIGMSVVFAFLALMVVAIKVQAMVVNRFFPEKPAAPKTPSSPSASGSNDGALVAAIMGAVKAYKNKHQ